MSKKIRLMDWLDVVHSQFSYVRNGWANSKVWLIRFASWEDANSFPQVIGDSNTVGIVRDGNSRGGISPVYIQGLPIKFNRGVDRQLSPGQFKIVYFSDSESASEDFTPVLIYYTLVPTHLRLSLGEIE